MTKKPATLTDQIRAAIDASPLTPYRIALDAEIDHSQLSKFRSGRGGLSLNALDRLGKVLGLTIVVDKRG
jgi:hypothetical protein